MRTLPKRHAGSPLRTNASINRSHAVTCFKAGMTGRQIAAAWPEVWKCDADGLIGQRYDYELADGSGRTETNRMIAANSVRDVLRRFALGHFDTVGA